MAVAREAGGCVTSGVARLQVGQHGKLKQGHEQHAMETYNRIRRAAEATASATCSRNKLGEWGAEVGRTPLDSGQRTAATTNPGSRCGWAGGGVKAGDHTRGRRTSSATTRVMTDTVHMHDLHATLLWLLGMRPQKKLEGFPPRRPRLPLLTEGRRVVKEIMRNRFFLARGGGASTPSILALLGGLCASASRPPDSVTGQPFRFSESAAIVANRFAGRISPAP